MKDETIFPRKIVRHRLEDRAERIASLLREDCRISLTKIASETNMPLPTVFKVVEKIQRHHSFSLEIEPTGRRIYGSEKIEQTINTILECLQKNPRMKLTEMSRLTRIPVSTLFDNLNRLKQAYRLRLELKAKQKS